MFLIKKIYSNLKEKNNCESWLKKFLFIALDIQIKENFVPNSICGSIIKSKTKCLVFIYHLLYSIALNINFYVFKFFLSFLLTSSWKMLFFWLSKILHYSYNFFLFLIYHNYCTCLLRIKITWDSSMLSLHWPYKTILLVFSNIFKYNNLFEELH